MAHAEPPGYRASQPRPKRKLEPFLPIIQQILADDRQAPKKQRHTAKRIFERLRDEHGYQGGKTVVKDAVRAWKQSHQEVFLPLSHPPGEAQVDFGEATVKLNGVETKVALFVLTLPYSGAIFIQAFPREGTETFLEGHRRAFEYLNGVPRRISYDNSAIAVIEVLKGRERKLTREFLRLQSHYLFQEHFCLVRRANEKRHVERFVGFARRNFLVPVPQIQSLRELAGHLIAAVNAVRLGMHLLHSLLNLSMPLGPRAGWPLPPGIVARRGDVQHLAQHGDGERVAMFADPGVFHSDSFAKYAVAFHRISRSNTARRNSRRSRLISSRNSSCEASSPHGAGFGASLACHFRRLCSPTPTARAAAANE